MQNLVPMCNVHFPGEESLRPEKRRPADLEPRHGQATEEIDTLCHGQAREEIDTLCHGQATEETDTLCHRRATEETDTLWGAESPTQLL